MVTLSSYDFVRGEPPIISVSGITLTARYKLRAKFHIPAYGNSWQATDLWNNDGMRLDNMPENGTWTVDLYAILYDDTAGTFSTTPFNTVTVTISDASVTQQCQQFPLSSTCCVCGGFQDPDHEDESRCAPPATKRDCERPAQPQAECGEHNFTVEYHPGETPPFTITSILYDSLCDVILDEDGNSITTTVG